MSCARLGTRSLLLAVLSALAAAAAPTSSADQPARLVVLVRHPETVEGAGRDPSLSPAGRARAAELAAALKHAGVVRVVASPLRRTREAADAFGLEPIVAPIGEGGLAAHVRAVASAVREAEPGGTVVVVGHSNTVPAILRELGGPEVAELDESDHASVFVLQLGPDPPVMVRLAFGD